MIRKIIITLAILILAETSLAAEVIKIAAVGDVMLGTENLLPPDGGRNLLLNSAAFIKGNDIAFFNYEGALTNVGQSKKKIASGRSYTFKTPPEYAKYLALAGFNMASLANNHVNDFGTPGREMTMDVLKKNNITFSGPVGVVARMVVRGVKTAMIAFAPYPHSHMVLDIPKAKKLVANLAKQNDIVIVSMHAGIEGEQAVRTPREMEMYAGEERGEVVRFARSMIDVGADMVIGHGPHVPRAMEVYKKRLIAYSLGNFCTMRGIRVTFQAGYAPLLLARVDENGKLLGGRIISFLQSPGKPPVLDPEKRAAKLIYRLGKLDFPKSNAVNADGYLVAP